MNKKIISMYNEKKTCIGKVIKIDSDSNLLIDLGNGTIGKMPKNEIELVKDGMDELTDTIINNKLNRVLKFKIISIDNDEVIVSAKQLEIEAILWIQSNLKVGMTVEGKVVSIQKYGVFIEILDGVVGLLHIEDISIARIKHPMERYKVGEKVKVCVKNYDRDTGRIDFSVKEILGTWEENIKKFKENTEVQGIAREREKNGIFVELLPNLVGLAEHKSGIEYGQKVTVYIKKIVPEKRKIKLLIVD